MPRKQAKVTISGRVQGVSFRANTRNKARSLGVTGWVKNLSTGGVKAVFEGDEEDVKELVNWCQTGPPMARVEDVDVDYSEYQGEFERFLIRH